MSGWFAMKHGITRHPIFQGRPDRLMVWVWLLDNAAFADTKQDSHGELVEVKRGQVLTTERQIAEQCGVGRQVVRTFLDRLRTEHMINPKPTQRRTLITICNYEKYQSVLARPNPAPNPRATQEQPIKEQDNKLPPSEDDPAKAIFDRGKALLAGAGMVNGKAGALIGKWRKEHSDQRVFEAIKIAEENSPSDPASFIAATLKRRQQPAPGSAAATIAAIRKQVRGA